MAVPFRFVRWLFLAAFACLLGATVCQADGLIIVRQPPEMIRPGHFAFAPLEVTYHRVSVEINDLVAVTTVDEEFYNPNNQQLEGTYVFPLPAGSHIDKFSMDVNGKLMDAELLAADKAKTLYEDVVRQMRDPALLEYAGRDALKVRIFPIEPGSRKKVKLSYTQLLKSDNGLTEYVYPLNTEKFSAAPLKDVSVSVALKSTDPIKTLYCPSHPVDIRRDGDRKAMVGFEGKDIRPDTDFKLIFVRNPSPLGINLLSYRTGAGDGYFLLLASPGADAPAHAVQQQDICFVLDTSGSMAGPKIEQAKKALAFCLHSLGDGDRFEVIRFSTESQSLFGGLQPASADNVGKAVAFVKDMQATGGTAISDALGKALAQRARRAVANNEKQPVPVNDRPYVVVFLTDGQPTVGETDEDALVKGVEKENQDATHIFSFGIGSDVNTHLLDRIADATHAFSTYVLPSEDIEVKLSNFYAKIKEPVLANVNVAFTGDKVSTSQLYPAQVREIYKGETLMLFGRYSGTGASAVKVTGTINGEARTFAQDVAFTDSDTSASYIPKLWATRRIGWLLDEIRLHGESSELKDEVVKLAREHGIVTPYTAYLILDDERRRHVPVALQNFRELGADDPVRSRAEKDALSLNQEAKNSNDRAGEQAVANAKAIQDYKQQAQAAAPQGFGGGQGAGDGLTKSSTVQPAPAGAGSRFGPTTGAPQAIAPQNGYRQTRSYAEQARVVNGRAFYQNESRWTDANAQAQHTKQTQQIAFASDAYFKLLKEHADYAGAFALGDDLDVVIDHTLYQIRPATK